MKKRNVSREHQLRKDVQILMSNLVVEKERVARANNVVLLEQEKNRNMQKALEALRARIVDLNNHRDILMALCQTYCRATGELAKLTVPLFTQPTQNTEAARQERAG